MTIHPNKYETYLTNDIRGVAFRREEGKTNRQIEHICTFFSATIDDTNLIFGHKLHIGTH
jgi:hypothetical protein